MHAHKLVEHLKLLHPHLLHHLSTHQHRTNRHQLYIIFTQLQQNNEQPLSTDIKMYQKLAEMNEASLNLTWTNTTIQSEPHLSFLLMCCEGISTKHSSTQDR